MTTTITGNYNATVTISNGGNSPLTVTSAGIIDPSAYSATGVYLLSGQSGVTKIVNDGKILGGLGALSPHYTGGYGGYGLEAFSGVNLSNTGTIAGGYGGVSYNGNHDHPGGQGGSGVVIGTTMASTLTNAGHIYGGDGGSSSLYGGAGGTGVDIYGAHVQVRNSGFIRGGEGGTGQFDFGGAGGDGVRLDDGPVMQNTGTIIGGEGGYTFSENATPGAAGAVLYSVVLTNKGVITGGQGGESGNGRGGQGGVGVLMDGGTLTNAGIISGGAAGYGYNTGAASGNAVDLFGSAVSTLVVDPGALFIGDVIANVVNGEAADVLELAGTSAVALTGIGTQFDGFGTISFAAGAAREIAGTAAALTTGESIKGFVKGDKIEITDAAAGGAKVSVNKAGVVTIKAGGVTYELDIAGAKKGETDFKFSNHTLTKTGSSKMAFIAPPAAAAPQAGLPALHEMAAAPAKPATSGWVVPAAMHGAGLPDLTRVPHGAVPAMVTLQSG